MGDLCLVINLGSSQFTVQASRRPWWTPPGLSSGMRDRIRTHDLQLQEELRQALSWWGDFDVIVVPADEEGMIARLCRRHSSPNNSSECTAGSAAIG